MKGSLDDRFKRELKEMIILECLKEVTPDMIEDGAPLFGDDSLLQLDSIDGLQVSVAIQKQYGRRVTDPKEVRRIMASIDTLADFLQPE